MPGENKDDEAREEWKLKVAQFLSNPEKSDTIDFSTREDDQGNYPQIAVEVDEVRFIAEKIRNNKTLNWISFERNVMGDKGIAIILNALVNNDTLTSLNLNLTGFSNEIAEGLANLIRTNKTLRRIYLVGGKIDEKGAELIAQELAKNTTITVFDLSNNSLGDEGAKAFAEVLKVNKTLLFLGLCVNQIGNEGAKVLADSLAINDTLLSLDLFGNLIGERGLEAFAHVMKDNFNVILIDLFLSNIHNIHKRKHKSPHLEEVERYLTRNYAEYKEEYGDDNYLTSSKNGVLAPLLKIQGVAELVDSFINDEEHDDLKNALLNQIYQKRKAQERRNQVNPDIVEVENEEEKGKEKDRERKREERAKRVEDREARKSKDSDDFNSSSNSEPSTTNNLLESSLQKETKDTPTQDSTNKNKKEESGINLPDKKPSPSPIRPAALIKNKALELSKKADGCSIS